MSQDTMMEPDIASQYRAEKAILHLFAAIDADDGDRVAAGFADDGVWHRGDRACVGRDAVRREMSSRAAGRLVRHLVLNVIARADAQEPGVVLLTCSVLALVDGDPKQRPSPCVTPFALDDYSATIVPADGRMLVRRLVATRMFAQ